MIAELIKRFSNSPRVGILMSGVGSNTRALLSHRYCYPSLQFVGIFTDNPSSSARAIADDYSLESVGIYESKRVALFDRLTAVLEERHIDVLIYAGFMRISPREFVLRFPGINCHPGDLTIISSSGLPKYRGMRALEEAVTSGETYVASTVHVVDADVDCGKAIAVSRHLRTELNDRMDIQRLHGRLKVLEHSLYWQVVALLERSLISENDPPLSEQRGEVTKLLNNLQNSA